MRNCNINNSFALYGSIIYFTENYAAAILIENCVFSNNSANFNLIDVGQSNLIIKGTIIENNTNNLFSIVLSTIYLLDSKIQNQICFTSLPGCILSAKEASLVSLKSSNFNNIISHIEEGNFYIEDSKFYFDSIQINFVKTPKKGSCFISHASQLNVVYSNFSNYAINCISSFAGNLSINNSYFDNSGNMQNVQKVLEYGSVYCSSCLELIIFKTNFVNNSKALDGSAIYVIANKNDKLKMALKILAFYLQISQKMLLKKEEEYFAIMMVHLKKF